MHKKIRSVLMTIAIVVAVMTMLFACSSQGGDVLDSSIVKNFEVAFDAYYALGTEIPADTAVHVTYTNGLSRDITFADITLNASFDKNLEGTQTVSATYRTFTRDISVRYVQVFTATYTASDDAMGSVRGTLSQSVLRGADAAAVDAIAAEGYRFVKWSDGMTAISRRDKALTANVSVAAEFEPIVYTVDFFVYDSAKNKFSLDTESRDSVAFGAEYTVPEYAFAVPEGYNFYAYSTQASAAGKRPSALQSGYYHVNDTVTPTSSISLYPVFLPSVVSVSFVDRTNNNRVLLTEENLPYNSTYRVYSKTLEAIKKVDIVFSLFNYSWHIQSSTGEDALVTESTNSSVLLKDNLIVYIEYEYVDVGINYVDGATTLFATTLKYGTSFDIYELADSMNGGVEYSQQGYENLKWCIGGTGYVRGDSYLVASNSTVVISLSKQLKSFDVSYVDVVDDAVIHDAQLMYGDALLTTQPEAPTREGFIFRGWYVDSACKQSVDFGATVATATTIYAGWYVPVQLSFTNVRLNYTYVGRTDTDIVVDSLTLYVPFGATLAADGDGIVDFWIRKNNVMTAVRSTNSLQPYKTGYEFAGWFYDSACTDAFASDDVVVAATQLYASMEMERYTLRVRVDCGSLTISCASVAHTHTLVEVPCEGEGKLYLRVCDNASAAIAVLRTDSLGNPVIRIAKNTPQLANRMTASYTEPIGYGSTVMTMGSSATNVLQNHDITPAPTITSIDGVSRNVYNVNFSLADSGEGANINSVTKEGTFYVSSVRRQHVITIAGSDDGGIFEHTLTSNGVALDASKYTVVSGRTRITLNYGEQLTAVIRAKEGNRLVRVNVGSQSYVIPAGNANHSVQLDTVTADVTVLVTTMPITFTMDTQGIREGEGSVRVVTVANGEVTDTTDTVTTGIPYDSAKGFVFSVPADAVANGIQLVGVKINGEFIFKVGATTAFTLDTSRTGYTGYLTDKFSLYLGADSASGYMVYRGIREDIAPTFVFAEPNVALSITVADSRGSITQLALDDVPVTLAAGQTTYSDTIDYGTALSVVATNNVGYKLQGITVNGVAVDELPDRVTEDMAIVFTFTNQDYTITVNSTGSGATALLNSSGSSLMAPYTFYRGDNAAFTLRFTPDTSSGYLIQSINVNGEPVEITNGAFVEYRIAAAAGDADYRDYTIDVVYALRNQNFRLVVTNNTGVQMGAFVVDRNAALSAADSIGATATGDYLVKYNSTAIISAKLNAGVYVSALKVIEAGNAKVNLTDRDAIAAVFADTYSVISVKKDIEVQISVALDAYSFTINETQNAQIKLEGTDGFMMFPADTYVHGTAFRIVVTPTKHYGIQNLSITVDSKTTNITKFTYEYDEVTGDLLRINSAYMYFSGDTEVNLTMKFNDYDVTLTNNVVDSAYISAITEIKAGGETVSSLPSKLPAKTAVSFKIAVFSDYVGKYAVKVYLNGEDKTSTVYNANNSVVSFIMNSATAVVVDYEKLDYKATLIIENFVSGNSVSLENQYFSANGTYVLDVPAMKAMSLYVDLLVSSRVRITVYDEVGAVIGTQLFATKGSYSLPKDSTVAAITDEFAAASRNITIVVSFQ